MLHAGGTVVDRCRRGAAGGVAWHFKHLADGELLVLFKSVGGGKRPSGDGRKGCCGVGETLDGDGESTGPNLMLASPPALSGLGVTVSM